MGGSEVCSGKLSCASMLTLKCKITFCVGNLCVRAGCVAATGWQLSSEVSPGAQVGVHLASTEVLDPQQNVWLSGPALSSRRFATAAAALNGAILIAGGYDGSQYLASAEMLDPRVGEWKPVRS